MIPPGTADSDCQFIFVLSCLSTQVVENTWTTHARLQCYSSTRRIELLLLEPRQENQRMAAPYPPVSARSLNVKDEGLISLELQDGTSYQGYSFGAPKSIAGELVFQTGMVGYPESITDPSYRGQILVITFPLVGNYGVPTRETMDELLKDLPAYFESSQIHIAGLVTASYAGEDYSHYLAKSSLGTWLKEQGVPAMYGVDTRALTKKLREQGSTLGRMLLQKSPPNLTNGHANGKVSMPIAFDTIDWVNPNERNLVADGKSAVCFQTMKKKG